MKSTAQLITFILAIVAGILAIREAPIASVFAFTAAACSTLPLWTRRREKE